MKKSSYLYKEIGEKVKMGPIWDMDWSSACMGDVKHTNKWQTNHFGMNAQGQQWYKFLVQDPYYLALAQVRYHEVRDLMEEMVKDGGTIDQQQEYLAESGADNDKLWPRGSFSRDSETLQTWLKQRLEWLDAQFASAEIFMASIANISSAGLDVTMSHLDGDLYADKYHDGLVGYQKDMKINVNTDDEVALFFNGKYLTSFDQDNKELVVSYEDLIMDETNVFTFASVNQNGEVDFTNSVTKTITYNESYPLSIAVSGDYKKDYPQGTRKFDETGLVVTAQMNDGTTYDATKEAIITGFNTDTVGTVTLDVAFRGATTTFDINVYKSEIPVGPEYPENLINTSAETDIKVIDYSSECIKGGYPDEDGLASNVLDYDSNTYWHNNYRTSVGLPQHLTFDLGKRYYVTDLAFLPRQTGSNGDIFTIKVYMGESADDMELVDTYTFDQDGKSLTNRTEFKRATLAEVGQFVKVEVTASGGGSLDTYATMSEIRFYGLAMEEEPSTPTVDKTALETALYNASEAYQNEAKYTVETYVPFKEAYDAAIVLKNKADATQKEVDEAVSVLENTQKALTMKPRELGALINTSKDSDVHVEDCDSYHVGEDGDKTLDYDPKTMWHSNWEGSDKLPLSVIYDLGKTYDLSDIQFLPRQDTSNNGDIFEFKLYVGNELDALAYVGTYKMETSGSGAKEALTNRSEFKRIMLEANGRYVKLSVTRSGADTEAKLNTFVSMSEIRFYGDEDGDAPVLPDIDKTALKAAIDVADTLEVTLDKYTFESVEAFDLAYSEAILIYAEKEVSQYAVNEATQALLDAIEGLEEWSFDDIDKEALLNLLDEADVVINNQTKYTEESYASFKAVYDTAILVCDSKTATQKEVDNTVITLRDAIDALEENSPVVTVDKAALNETISEVEALVEADYSRISWSNLQTALTAAKEVVADDAATQKVVDAAVSSLEANKAALVNVVEMKEAIAAAEAKLAEADKYTDETVAELTTVYNNAEYAINSNIGYVQADADMHATNINNAISALVEKPVEPE